VRKIDYSYFRRISTSIFFRNRSI